MNNFDIKKLLQFVVFSKNICYQYRFSQTNIVDMDNFTIDKVKNKYHISLDIYNKNIYTKKYIDISVTLAEIKKIYEMLLVFKQRLKIKKLTINKNKYKIFKEGEFYILKQNDLNLKIPREHLNNFILYLEEITNEFTKTNNISKME